MSKFRFFLIDHSCGFLNYYFAKFLEILTTGSLEISKFVPKQSVSIFRATAHALHLTGFFFFFFFLLLLLLLLRIHVHKGKKNYKHYYKIYIRYHLVDHLHIHFIIIL